MSCWAGRGRGWGLAWYGAALILAGCHRDSSVSRLPDVTIAEIRMDSATDRSDPAQTDLSPRLLRRFSSIHLPTPAPNSAVIRLGRMLYFEPLLSRTGQISCNSCHPLDRYGTTGSRFSTGVDGALGRRNAPTVYNAVGHFRLFWDGRAATLDEQALAPIVDPVEMGMQADGAVTRIKQIAGYQMAFARAYPETAEPVTIGHIAAAIAEFERGLVTPARWDRYVDGDSSALSSAEKDGARLFSNLGCMVCHTGAYVGGTMYEKLGIFLPWPNQADRGRRGVTHDIADDMVFKVPSLRNVAQTAPYFHDGSAATLDTAVRLMARHQLGVELTEGEARSIAAWLGSLTGEIPVDYIRRPELPPAVRP
jgi:cytochrome c peroxidase